MEQATPRNACQFQLGRTERSTARARIDLLERPADHVEREPRRVDLARAIDGDQRPVSQNGNPIGQLEDLVEAMRNVQDGDALLAAAAADGKRVAGPPARSSWRSARRGSTAAHGEPRRRRFRFPASPRPSTPRPCGAFRSRLRTASAAGLLRRAGLASRRLPTLDAANALPAASSRRPTDAESTRVLAAWPRCLRSVHPAATRTSPVARRERITPPSGDWTPLNSLMSVDFPAPFSPTSPRISPASSRGRRLEEPVTPANDFVRPASWMSGSDINNLPGAGPRSATPEVLRTQFCKSLRGHRHRSVNDDLFTEPWGKNLVGVAKRRKDIGLDITPQRLVEELFARQRNASPDDHGFNRDQA